MPWNKGLTKETDSRVAAVATDRVRRQRISDTLRKAYADGRRVSFFRGKAMRTGVSLSETTKQKLREAGKRWTHRSGFHLSEETKGRISQSVRARMRDPAISEKSAKTQFKPGIIPWNKGKAVPQVTQFLKKRWQDPYWRDIYLTRPKKKPNKPEKRLLGLLECYFTGQWLYTGNGKAMYRVGGKRPDFSHTAKPLLIELFGDYYHSPKNPGYCYNMSEEGLVSHYLKCGFRCLVIWERELKESAAVVAKVSKFLKGAI